MQMIGTLQEETLKDSVGDRNIDRNCQNYKY